MPKPWPVKPCGTTAAYRRHLRHRTPPCPECLAANRRHVAAMQAKADPANAGSLTPETRVKRNGLPAFVPYVYRGTGRDELTWWMDDEPAAGAA